MMKNLIISFLFLTGLLITTHSSFAHCDTKDGPVVAAAIKAIKQKNINYALIWVKPSYEKEIKEAFESTMKVRVLVLRSGEGMTYTGVKPAAPQLTRKFLLLINP